MAPVPSRRRRERHGTTSENIPPRGRHHSSSWNIITESFVTELVTAGFFNGHRPPIACTSVGVFYTSELSAIGIKGYPCGEIWRRSPNYYRVLDECLPSVRLVSMSQYSNHCFEQTSEGQNNCLNNSGAPNKPLAILIARVAWEMCRTNWSWTSLLGTKLIINTSTTTVAIILEPIFIICIHVSDT